MSFCLLRFNLQFTKWFNIDQLQYLIGQVIITHSHLLYQIAQIGKKRKSVQHTLQCIQIPHGIAKLLGDWKQNKKILNVKRKQNRNQIHIKWCIPYCKHTKCFHPSVHVYRCSTFALTLLVYTQYSMPWRINNWWILHRILLFNAS